MNVQQMQQATMPMMSETPIVARMPDGTIWTIERAMWRMNRKHDSAEIVLQLGSPQSENASNV